MSFNAEEEIVAPYQFILQIYSYKGQRAGKCLFALKRRKWRHTVAKLSLYTHYHYKTIHVDATDTFI